jgi:hypothetical protein
VFDDTFDLIGVENREHNEFTIVREHGDGRHGLAALSCQGGILRSIYVEASDRKTGMEEPMRKRRPQQA